MCREDARRVLIEALDSVSFSGPLMRKHILDHCMHLQTEGDVSHAYPACSDTLPSVMQRRGKKVLVLDPRVSGFLGLLAEVSLLKEHGVEQ